MSSIFFPPPAPLPASQPPTQALDAERLRQVIDIALRAGQLLMQNGASSLRVENTLIHLTRGLGCDSVDVLVSSNAIVMTTSSGEQYRTKLRRVGGIAVNLTVVSGINRLSRRVVNGELDAAHTAAELERIASLPSHYPAWLVVIGVGLACAGFSNLFQGDWAAFAITWISGSLAMLARTLLHKQGANTLLTVIVTAFVAGLLAALGVLTGWSATPRAALAASVLLLVPGVPLITAMADMTTGHLVTGLTRGLWGGLISLCIAIGLLLAISLTGVGL